MNNTILNFIKSWKPIGDRIVVLPQKKMKETESGIAMGNTSQGEDKKIIGKVLSVGQGIYSENGNLIPMHSKEGDIVLFSKYAGEDFLVDENMKVEKYNGIVRDDQILVTIVKQETLLSSIPEYDF